MSKMTHKKAVEYLHQLWENGEVPSNFTEDHSYYSDALNQLKTLGYIDWDDICF